MEDNKNVVVDVDYIMKGLVEVDFISGVDVMLKDKVD